MARNCPANCCGNAKSEVREYCLYDITEAIKYRLELTEEQVRMIEWMIDHSFATDIELSEWCDSFEDIGRIYKKPSGFFYFMLIQVGAN